MKPLFILSLVLLGACDRGPPAPTAEQNRQLDEMEEALDAEANRAATAP
jgi:hypothetical protein